MDQRKGVSARSGGTGREGVLGLLEGLSLLCSILLPLEGLVDVLAIADCEEKMRSGPSVEDRGKVETERVTKHT